MGTRLTFTQGDTAKLRVFVTDADGVALNLDTYTSIVFTIKRSQQDLDAAAEFQGTLGDEVVLADDVEDNNAVDITLPEDLILRTGRLYFWDLEISDGTSVFTPCGGDILVSGQTTSGT